MAQVEFASENVLIPEGVEVSLEGKKISVKGPLGELTKDFSFVDLDVEVVDGKVFVRAVWPDKRRRALVGTIRSHIRNMFTGVTTGYTYRLKVISAHFPMTAKVDKDRVIIDNFGGERKSRIGKILGDTKVEVANEDITVRGLDLQDVSQTAANIQKSTWIKKKDPRVFLDGVYVFEKRKGM